MSTPNKSDYVASLFDFAGMEISKFIRERVASSERILDVGAGWGKYRFLLPEYEFDCIEIWEPNIKTNRLDAYYRIVFNKDVIGFIPKERYGAIILGDVLEHMDVKNAQEVIRVLCEATDFLCVAVPYSMKHGISEDNPFEIHKQDDLTKEIIKQRYPQLEFYMENNKKAIFIKGGSTQ